MAHHQVNGRLQSLMPTDNDVLCGRGVNIAHHAGNERFRTLVNTKRDQCLQDPNSPTEKRQLAEEIMYHIKSLDPPGRFLKRECPPGRRSSSRGKNGTGLDLSGTWELVTDREAIKKTCQALRDSCRTDRNGYAIGVVAPPDVADFAVKAGVKRDAPSPLPDHDGGNGIGRLSPSVENAACWLKKQKFPSPEHSQLGTSLLEPITNDSVDGNGGDSVSGSVMDGSDVSSILPIGNTPGQGIHDHLESTQSSMLHPQNEHALDHAPASVFASANGWNNGGSSLSYDLGSQSSLHQTSMHHQHNIFNYPRTSVTPTSVQHHQTHNDWGPVAFQVLSSHNDNIGVELGSPGDPGSLHITEL